MNTTSAKLGPLLLKFVLLVAVLIIATWGAHAIRDALNLQIRPSNEQQIHQVIMFGMVAYVGLLALPFVPGAEIGLAMLAAFGPSIAPLIYVATVASMMLAYMVGRFLPIKSLQRLLSLLRLRRAAALVEKVNPLSGEERLEILLGGQPKRSVSLALRFRYIALALAVNTPGNSLIGGGGGIMMIAGLSGIFSPLLTFATVALAVSPVPLAMMYLGLQI